MVWRYGHEQSELGALDFLHSRDSGVAKAVFVLVGRTYARDSGWEIGRRSAPRVRALGEQLARLTSIRGRAVSSTPNLPSGRRQTRGG